MSFSATRLTCYALLSALEEDLRAEIELHVQQTSPAAVLGVDRAAQVQARRAKDSGGRTTDSLAALLPYLDFADSYEILLGAKPDLPGDLRDQLGEIAPRLGRLVAVRNRVAHTRPMEIDDLPNVLDLAELLCKAPGLRWTST